MMFRCMKSYTLVIEQESIRICAAPLEGRVNCETYVQQI